MRKYGKKLFLITLVLAQYSWSNLYADDILVIGNFSSLDAAMEIPAQWEPLTFPSIDRHTDYSVINRDGRTVIQARSKAAASGLIRKLDNIDPARYPWLIWQWRIQGILEKGDVTTKEGDDCVARIYVAFEFIAKGKTMWERIKYKAACIAAGKPLPGSAITYIWANKALKGTIIDSPYTARSKMVVVESGRTRVSKWVNEKRNIVQDYQTAFGHTPPKIMGIAIMTDTDNTRGSTIAYYGDIRLAVSVTSSHIVR